MKKVRFVNLEFKNKLFKKKYLTDSIESLITVNLFWDLKF